MVPAVARQAGILQPPAGPTISLISECWRLVLFFIYPNRNKHNILRMKQIKPKTVKAESIERDRQIHTAASMDWSLSSTLVSCKWRKEYPKLFNKSNIYIKNHKHIIQFRDCYRANSKKWKEGENKPTKAVATDAMEVPTVKTTRCLSNVS